MWQTAWARCPTVGTRVARGPMIVLNDQQPRRAALRCHRARQPGRPGFDWLFDHGIVGLMTQWVVPTTHGHPVRRVWPGRSHWLWFCGVCAGAVGFASATIDPAPKAYGSSDSAGSAHRYYPAAHTRQRPPSGARCPGCRFITATRSGISMPSNPALTSFPRCRRRPARDRRTGTTRFPASVAAG